LKNAWIVKARALLSPPAPAPSTEADRSAYERLAIPHTFKPQLSLWEALIAATGALLRIFLGSLLFAFWGGYTLLGWSTIRNPFLRVAVLVPFFLLFLAVFALLMLAISALVRAISPRRP
jgi:hypothetical protein